MRKTLLDFGLDGGGALEYVLAASPYAGLDQAVASLALFSHPQTVAQAAGQALFRICRGPIPQRGQIVSLADGSRVLLDDNTGPTDAFIWANRVRRGSYNDVQFCHVWQASGDASAYTNLANLCVLPSFLAKLSDTHPRIVQMLRWRAEQLYGWRASSAQAAVSDQGFSALDWASPLPVTAHLEKVLRAEMTTKPKSRTTISCREIGWVFSGWEPDPHIAAADRGSDGPR